MFSLHQQDQTGCQIPASRHLAGGMQGIARMVSGRGHRAVLFGAVAPGTQKLYPNRKAPSGKGVSPTCLVSVLSSKIGQGFDL